MLPEWVPDNYYNYPENSLFSFNRTLINLHKLGFASSSIEISHLRNFLDFRQAYPSLETQDQDQFSRVEVHVYMDTRPLEVHVYMDTRPIEVHVYMDTRPIEVYEYMINHDFCELK